ncbi:MAG: hypothetical protein GY737_02325 [Desulfobacteraceae bacterium]|nr:hypothetical protein [Desulfobacteraceae bacterium]
MDHPAGPEIPPWKIPEEWNQALQSIEIPAQRRWDKLENARMLAGCVRQDLTEISTRIEAVAGRTCTVCEDICCCRATVWFDFRDLLFIYLNFGRFPAGQITRTLNGACSCLSSTGCTLERLHRPFLCTWYCCPAQIRVMEGEGPGTRRAFEALLNRIKANRKALEDAFIAAVG